MGLIALLFVVVAETKAQRQELFQGMVVDSATFSALPFVSIRIKASMRGTTTDVKGSFSISASRNDTLVFTLVGYETVELSLWDWEPGMLRMRERETLLKEVIIRAAPTDPYDGMFDKENEKLARRRTPFYLSKVKKEKRKLGWLREDNLRVKTYVDLVINNPDTKAGLMQKYGLSEDQYYKILGDFNAKNYSIMYYLTTAELLSLLNTFFERSMIK